MANKAKNPFTLSFGEEPVEYMKRDDEVESIVASIASDPPLSRSFLITGVRGSGKTVLLGSVEQRFAESDEWIVVELNSSDDLREALAAKLYSLGKVKHLFLDKEFSFSFHGASFSISGKNPVLNIEDLLERIFAELKKRKKRVLVCVDEVFATPSMKSFALTMQMLNRHGCQITFLGTGLFENISELENSPNLTFLIRSPKIVLSPLPFASIAASYRATLDVDESKAREFALFTKGYAFAFQLLGYLLFKEPSKELSPSLLASFDAYLERYVYDKIWSSLSKGDKKVLTAFISNSPAQTGVILKSSGLSKDSFSRYRDRLIKKGLIASPEWGLLVLALPRFKEFMDIAVARDNALALG